MEKQNENDKEEQEIQEALKQPFDYGSEEYLALIKKIKQNRAAYRAQQELTQVLRYKMIKGVYDK